jgi:hypothetical protein
MNFLEQVMVLRIKRNQKLRKGEKYEQRQAHRDSSRFGTQESVARNSKRRTNDNFANLKDTSV